MGELTMPFLFALVTTTSDTLGVLDSRADKVIEPIKHVNVSVCLLAETSN